MRSTNNKQPVDFIPPSEEIQRLFVLPTSTMRVSSQAVDSKPSTAAGENNSSSSSLVPISDDCGSRKDEASKQITNVEDYSFSEEEFAKMPSTLMKAVRRTDELLIQTEAARKSAIETNNEVKGIHSLLVRHARKILKDGEKSDILLENNSEKGKTRGFRRKCSISNKMCDFMGLEPGTNSSRVDVNKAINEYIKKNGLIDKENAQYILPDEKLWSILSEDAKGNKITYFSIQKYIKHHYVVSS
jgi:chromatin remodeling complex protein RSC6